MNQIATPSPSYRSSTSVAQFVLIAAQVSSLVLVARLFHIENTTFHDVVTIALLGFLLSYFMPTKFRQPLFVIISLLSIGWIMGPLQGAWLIAIGLVLIGIAHLPLPYSVRVALIVSAGLGLAFLRSDPAASPWSSAIWPILGAMFMFRLVVYMYDLKNRSGNFGFWHALSYFFMFPTLSFPLFPIVDYKTFSRSLDAGDRFEVGQKGVEMMARGMIHLLLYRLVYQYLAVDPASIQTASDAMLYLVYPYLLYLKISGSFHVAIGILGLFGYSLPRTNRYYFLASSFTDYWRRINIYWKDYIQKILFQPAYLFISRRVSSSSTSFIAATIAAFAGTWALHSYQWFWIRGSFPIVWQEIAFWLIMGAAVLTNILVENRFGRRRSLGVLKRSWGDRIVLAAKTISTFVLVVLLWAFWTSKSTDQYLFAIKMLGSATGPEWMLFIGLLTLLGAVAIIADYIEQTPGKLLSDELPKPWTKWAMRPLAGLTTATAMLVVGYGGLLFYYPPAFANIVDGLKSPLRLNTVDAQAMDRGYYEDLTNVGRFNPELAKLYEGRPADWERCWAMHRTGQFPTHVLMPERSVVFKNATLTTNAWGMRDRDYSLEKPAGTVRIALLGASHAMGAGVGDLDTYENVIEDTLNKSGARQEYEILNFSVSAYGPLSRLAVLQRNVMQFQPDIIISVGINDLRWIEIELMKSVRDGYDIPFPPALEVLEQIKLNSDMSEEVATRQLRTHSPELLLKTYKSMAEIAENVGAHALLLVQPRVRHETDEWSDEASVQISAAQEAGLDVLDIRSAYTEISSLEMLWLAPWDSHPNVRGHQLLANALLEKLEPTISTYSTH